MILGPFIFYLLRGLMIKMKHNGKTKFLISSLGLFSLFTLLIFWPIFLGKVNINGNLMVSFYRLFGENLPYKNNGLDQFRLFYPHIHVTLWHLKNFRFALWNPWAFSGSPNLADFQSAVLYPLNIFGFFLPQISYWHFLRLTPQILASFFTLLYLRGLKLSKLSAFFGAIAFGFSPLMLSWGDNAMILPHSIIWLPLLLYAIDGFRDKKNKKFLLLISLGVAFSILSGFFQTTIYLLILVSLYILIRSDNVKQRILLFAFLAIGILISTAQLLPSAELYFQSARSSVPLTNTLFNFLLPISTLLSYFSPDFFGNPATHNFFRGGSAEYFEGVLFIGIAPLVFFFYALFAKLSDKLVKFFSIIGIISLSTSLNLISSRLFLSLPIPFLSSSIANRILFVPTFCFVVVAAIGMDWWLNFKDKREIMLKVLIFLAIDYILIFIYLLSVKLLNFPYFKFHNLSAYETSLISARNLLVPFVIFLIVSISTFTLNLKTRITIAILIISTVFLHSFYFANKTFSFSEKTVVFPKTEALDFIQKNQGVWRTVGIGEANIPTNIASQYEIYSPDGYDSLNKESYAQFIQAMRGDGVNNISRADAGVGSENAKEFLENKNTRKLINILGIKYVLSLRDNETILKNANFRRVFEESRKNSVAVFENEEVMPRVFLASSYENVLDLNSANKSNDKIEKEKDELIIQKLLSDSFDFRNTLLLEEPSPISPKVGLGIAEIVSYKPEEVVIRTKSSDPKLLFLSDNYYPGWKAKVDGEETRVLRADYAFRAVPLAEGEHNVVFYYDSETFKIGLMISMAALAVCLFLVLSKNPLTGRQ